ncbi:unnamed protein product [Boreogadus saida]
MEGEEAFYQFVNNLSDEDYRLMRDNNLLGSPVEVTEDELLSRLQQVVGPEPPNSSPSTETGEATGETAGGSEDSSNGDTLLDWLNTVRRTGNTTRSGHRGNQSWRAVSQTNPNSGDFRFSLEINVNRNLAEQQAAAAAEGGQETQEAPGAPGEVAAAGMPSAAVPAAGVTAVGVTAAVPEAEAEPEPQAVSMEVEEVVEEPVVEELAVIVEPEPEFEDAVMQEHNGEPTVPVQSPAEPGLAQPGVAPLSAWSGWTVFLTFVMPPALSRPLWHLLRAALGLDNTCPLGRASRVRSAAGSGGGGGGPECRSSRRRGRGCRRRGAGGRRPPTIMLDLQVRRVWPGECRQRDSFANRTRSRSQNSNNTFLYESEQGGFRRTFSHTERVGVRTYVSTIRIPIRRISDAGLGEATSMALQFGELSYLMDSDSESSDSNRGAGTPAEPTETLNNPEGASAPVAEEPPVGAVSAGEARTAERDLEEGLTSGPAGREGGLSTASTGSGKDIQRF